MSKSARNSTQNLQALTKQVLILESENESLKSDLAMALAKVKTLTDVNLKAQMQSGANEQMFDESY